jgi:uracil-DNA glycosylase family 4
MAALPLETEIRRRIEVAGPMPVGQYMSLCLAHPEHGYYITRDPLGRDGDFTTSPEISQMFGELIGLWAATVWQAMGSPPHLNLVELGPGHGTLMRDALRAVQVVPDFHARVSVHMVEVSPLLMTALEAAWRPAVGRRNAWELAVHAAYWKYAVRRRLNGEKRRSFAAERYWGRPIPGWGADQPAVLIVGLAPAAHGGNRTGRIFTGDRSGDVLFASLWRCGLAAQPASVAAGDGQRLLGARMVAAVRCAPPANKPSVAERDACAPWLAAELAHVRSSVRVVVCLGQFAWQAIWPQLGKAGFPLPRPRPAFGHGAEARVASSGGSGEVLLIGCYHPSQQNTFTGRVTDDMLDGVFRRARQQAGL